MAKKEPLTFVIKKVGAFTQAVFDQMNEGSTIYLRGPYGDVVLPAKAKRAIIIAGDTGEAVALPLAQRLNDMGTPMSFLVGTSVPGNHGILQEPLSEFGPYRCISDEGKPGRALDYLDEVISEAQKDGTNLKEIAFYLIGPEIFMNITAKKLLGKGASSDMVLLSMEKNTMCGVGLCGECSCGGRMTCQYGTFLPIDFLIRENAL